MEIHAIAYVGHSLCWCSFVGAHWVVLCWPLLLNLKAQQFLGFIPPLNVRKLSSRSKVFR